MKFAICNEMFVGWPHARVARAVADLGYHGVELAPFTLGERPAELPAPDRAAVRLAFEDAGLEVVGLHWLLAKTTGLSITSEDDGELARTRAHLERLAGLCRELGGTVMVFGSPQQRAVGPGREPGRVLERVAGLFRTLSPRFEDVGVTLCFEPLTPAETDFVNTMAEGVALVEAVNHPAFRLHLDVKAMCGAETRPPADVIREEGGRYLRHFHANDPNLLGPGMGDVDQRPVGKALREVGYDRWVSVETFAEGPGPRAVAERSLAALKDAYGA